MQNTCDMSSVQLSHSILSFSRQHAEEKARLEKQAEEENKAEADFKPTTGIVLIV